MTGPEVANLPAVHLRWQEKKRRVVVVPADEDRYVITVQDVIEACARTAKESAYERQFTFLLNRLGQWIHRNRSKIAQAYLTLRDAGLLLLVVRKGRPLDAKFEDNLSVLDVEIAQNPQLDLIHLSVLALPNTSDEVIASFLSPKGTFAYRHAN